MLFPLPTAVHIYNTASLYHLQGVPNVQGYPQYIVRDRELEEQIILVLYQYHGDGQGHGQGQGYGDMRRIAEMKVLVSLG